MLRRFVVLLLLGGNTVLVGCTTTNTQLQTSVKPLKIQETGLALAFQADPAFGTGLDEIDKSKLSVAELKALEYGSDGQKIGWTGNGEGVSGEVVSYQPFRVGRSNCRRFAHSLSVNEKLRSVDGTACRKGEGRWKLVQ